MPAPRALTVAGKIALWALGIAAGAAVLVAGGALLLLRTDFVGKRLAQEVTKQAAEAIEGKLSLSNVRTSGLLQVCAEDVKLDDPLGRPALRAKEVCVSIDVGALVSKAAHVRSLRLVEPQLEWTEVPGKEPGTKTTTLLLALASKKPPKPKSGGPTAWTVQADGLEIERGRVQLRKSPEAAPGFAVEELSLKDGAARWAATSLGAKLALSGEVTVPGKLAALVSIDAGLDGDPATGRALLREVRLKLGQSGLVASGSFDLGKKSGAIKLREIQVAPRELELLLPKRADGAHAIPLASLLTGEADLDANGTEATLALRLAGGGGKLTGAAKSTLTAPYKWSLDLDGKGIDPRALVFGAPKGRIASRLSVQGKGIPQIDEEGVNGDVKLKLVVGPAKLDAVGAIALELEGSLLGRYLIVKTLDLDALGLKIDGRGAASREELSLDLDIDASDLALLGRNVGVLSGKAALRLDGDAHLTTRLTGSVDKPDAELKVRGKKVAFGSSLEAQEMNISGLLKGKLERPHGSLTFESQHLSLGGIDLGKPRVGVQLDWPTAHLRVEADVKNNDGEAAPGQLLIVGDATLDKRGDGVLLSNLSLTLPGNRFELRKAAHIKFSPKETELEPIELHSDHGDVAVAAALQKPYGKFPGRIDAAFTLTQFDLDRVPDFVLPPDLGLKGMVDAHLGVTGVPSSPDVDGQLTLTNVEAAGVRGLSGKLQAAVQRGRLRVSGEVAGPFGAKAQLKASWPVLPLAQTPKASLDATLTLAGVDLAQVSSMKRPKDDERPPSMKGTVAAQLLAKGTWEKPQLTLAVSAQELEAGKIHGVALDSTLKLGGLQALLDAQVELFGHKSLALTGRVPLDLAALLKAPAEWKKLLAQAGTLTVASNQLTFDELARAGLAPPDAKGPLEAELVLSGTLAKPRLLVEASGQGLAVSGLHDLGVGLKVALDHELTVASSMTLGEAKAKLDATLALSATECVALAQKGFAREQLDPLLERAWSGTLTLDDFIIGKMAAMTTNAKAPGSGPLAAPLFQGALGGKLTLAGTPEAPKLEGKFALDQLVAGQAKMGRGDLYVSADSQGAVLHVGLNPPNHGGVLLAHADLQADLSATSLLDDGADAVLDGTLTGHVQAQRFDLSVLSNATPTLRRAAGMLDADIELDGLLGRPWATGEAHLKSAAFDLAGVGALDDVGLDATFSPKEIVCDRLSGSLGGGQFSAVLVLGRRTATGDDDDRLEFTGELHFGDEEAARDRLDAQGKPQVPTPVPIRVDGADLANIVTEMEFYGDYEQGQVAATVQMPKTLVRVLSLPDKKLPKLKPNPDVLVAWPNDQPALAGVDPKEMRRILAARKNANLRVDVALDLQNLRVSAPDFDLPVSSQMHVAWDASNPDKPIADGSIEVSGGTFSALGRRFEIDEAKITETGGDIADPELEIQARYENPQASVLVLISGTATAPQIDLSSTPAMDQDAIAFFLATGRIQGHATQQGGGVDLTNAATSVLGAALFGQLRKNLNDVLPIDVVTVEGGQGNSGPQASLGKYIGDRLFIGYRQRFAASVSENQIEVRAEFLLGRQLASEGTYGDKTKGVSVLYTIEW